MCDMWLNKITYLLIYTFFHLRVVLSQLFDTVNGKYEKY